MKLKGKSKDWQVDSLPPEPPEIPGDLLVELSVHRVNPWLNTCLLPAIFLPE